MNINNKIETNQRLIWGVIHDLEFIPLNVQKEDLEQIGGIALWKAIEDYNEEENMCSFTTFAHKRIKRSIIDYCRRAMAVKRRNIIVEEPFSEGVEKEVISSMLVDEIYRWLDKESADMFIDKHSNKITYEQLAEEHNMSIKQVRSRLSKAIKILQKNIKWED